MYVYIFFLLCSLLLHSLQSICFHAFPFIMVYLFISVFVLLGFLPALLFFASLVNFAVHFSIHCTICSSALQTSLSIENIKFFTYHPIICGFLLVVVFFFYLWPRHLCLWWIYVVNLSISVSWHFSLFLLPFSFYHFITLQSCILCHSSFILGILSSEQKKCLFCF